MSVNDDLKRIVRGDVAADEETLKSFSRDTSIFERKPKAVVFPRDERDVAEVVKYVHGARARGENVSVAARAAGSDMTGGPLTSSISLVFTKYMNKISEFVGDAVRVEPGMYYRDFEKETLKKYGMLLPSYPASREICALGGIVANNSGGELTLKYGKTNDYVRSLDVVLSDGSTAKLKPLSKNELEAKKKLNSFEGEIYRHVDELLNKNETAIQAARPNVSKNSAGYALWNVRDKKRGTFDLSQLVCGSQGTLAIVTNSELGLVKLPEHRTMLVVFLKDISLLPETVARVMKYKPESFESYDDHTFRLAVRFFPQILKHAGARKLFGLAISFTREAWMVLTGGVPKLVLLAEFAEHTPAAARALAHAARATLHDMDISTTIAESEAAASKYWAIRRESFSLLRQNLRGLYAAPFIDDIVVRPSDYPTFLPELTSILDQHKLIYTIAGHIGDGNFHIIPLLNLGSQEARKEILELTPKIYSLTAKYHGSITGEHNDGIIRTPYLSLMFGDEMVRLFAETKKIFDPLNILNPGKKVGGTLADIESSMLGS